MSSTEIILNRANVALARSQRLVASWLPPQTTEEQSSNTKSEEELQREEDEIFTAVPETYIALFPLMVFGENVYANGVNVQTGRRSPVALQTPRRKLEPRRTRLERCAEETITGEELSECYEGEGEGEGEGG